MMVQKKKDGRKSVYGPYVIDRKHLIVFVGLIVVLLSAICFLIKNIMFPPVSPYSYVDPAYDDGRPPIKVDLLTPNEYSRPCTPTETIQGIVIHYVGNPGTTAQANRNYFASLADGAEGTYASSHFLVGLEGEVLQCVPLTEIAYASNIRNEDTVSIEVCHPDETGLFSDVTYARTVELTAWLCRTFDLDPETDVIRHYDVTGKICPRYYVEHPEAWEGFLADTAAELARQAEAEP